MTGPPMADTRDTGATIVADGGGLVVDVGMLAFGD